MTDISMEQAGAGRQRRLDVTSDAARARIRGRYRAETRFKSYGIAALVVTGLFLAVLMFDILRNGLPAFWQHSLLLDVPVKADVVDPAGKREPAAIKGADYFPLMKAAVDAAIPGIEGRSASKQLSRLLSVGAPDSLRDMLVADPSLIGKTIKVPLILSDDGDLYYKGVGTKVVSRPARGTATPSGVKGEITVLTSANDFADELTSIKDTLRAREAEMMSEAARIERATAGKAADKVKEFRDGAAALRARYEQAGISEVLDSKLPSVLVGINGGLVKVTKLDASGITGDVLLPLQSAAEAKPGAWQVVRYATAEADRKVTDQEVAFLERFREIGAVQNGFNWRFF